MYYIHLCAYPYEFSSTVAHAVIRGCIKLLYQYFLKYRQILSYIYRYYTHICACIIYIIYGWMDGCICAAVIRGPEGIFQAHRQRVVNWNITFIQVTHVCCQCQWIDVRVCVSSTCIFIKTFVLLWFAKFYIFIVLTIAIIMKI